MNHSLSQRKMESTGSARGARRRQPYAWLGTGVLGVGIGAALAGAGLAHADGGRGTDASPGPSSSSESSSAAPAGTVGNRTPGRAAFGPGVRVSTAAASVPTATSGNGRTTVRASASVYPVATPATSPPLGVVKATPVAVNPAQTAAVPVSTAQAAQAAVSPAKTIPVAAATVPAQIPSTTKAPETSLGAGPGVGGSTVFGKPGALRNSVLASAGFVPKSPAAMTPVPPSAPLTRVWQPTTRDLGPVVGAVVWAAHEVSYQLQGLTPLVKAVQLPTAGPQTTVAGTLNTVGPFGNPVAFSVTGQPGSGSVTLDQQGFYTYTPGAALATTGGTDTFTVTATDTGFHLENIFGLPGHHTTVTVPVSVAATPLTEPAASGDIAYSVTNTSYQPMQFANYTVNQASLSPAPGTVITTGQSALFEVAPGNSVAVAINPVGVSHDGVLNTIGVGYLPFGIGVQPDGSRVYVANQNSNTVSVINTTTNSVQANIGLGGGLSPFGLAVSPDGTHVYTADYASNAVTVIDTATETSSAVVGVGKYPKMVAVSPDSSRVYVTNSGSNSVSVIDSASNTVTATIGVGTTPLGVAASPDGARVYVANVGSGSMSVIDAGTNQVTGFINTSANWVAVSPDSKVVYATSADNVVKVIDTATNQVTDTISIPVPAGAGASLGMPAVSADGGRLFVPNILGNSVVQIDTATKKITNTVGVGKYPDYVAVSPDGTRAYVSNGSGNSVSVIGVVAPGTIGDGGVAQYTLTIDGSGQVSCSAKGSNQCEVSGTSVYLDDTPGTIYYVPVEDAQGQSNVLQNLVYSDTSNATFFTKSSPTVGYTNPLIPNGYSPYYNGTSATSKNTYYISSTTSQTSNVEYNVSVAVQQQAKMGALTLIAEEGAQYTWGTSTTNSFTYTQATTQTVRPGEVLYLYVENAVYRFYGDWNVLYGNTTYVLQNVWYDTPYSYSGYPSYLAAYTCDVGSAKCAQLAAGDLSGLDNPFPKTLPTYPVAESNKDNNYNTSPANAVTTSA